MQSSYPVILSIAGSDSSGGAGIQADIKAIAATGGFAATVITALTAQNTQGVDGIYPIPGAFVAQQLQAVFSDLNIQSIKIGMLFNADIIEAVKKSILTHKSSRIIVDPVMVAKSGDLLLSEDSMDALKTLLPLAYLITPNIPEAEKLCDQAIHDQTTMEKAALKLATLYKTNVLLKGGHAKEANKVVDVLCFYETQLCEWYEQVRINTTHTHGTGCTLSAAIASYIGQGVSLKDAVTLAKHYLQKAIIGGQTLAIGKGCGPLHHFAIF